MNTTQRSTFFAVALLVGGLTAMPNAAQGTVILDQTWTGAGLFNDPTISFPTRTPILNGNQLRFDAPGVYRNAKLIEIPLLPAHSLTNSTPVIITVNFNLTRGSSDFDPSIFMNDGGINYAGFNLGDNLSGSADVFSYVDADRNNVMDSYTDVPIFSNAGFPSVGNAFDVTTIFTLENTSTNVFGAFLAGLGNANAVALDPTAALSLSFWGNDSNEIYGFNTVHVQVESTSVPVPGTGLLFCAGLSGLAGFVWKRRRRG